MCPHLHCRLGVDSVSEHQTTNLGVGSSNLFGRANKINSLGRMWPVDDGPFFDLGHTFRYTIALMRVSRRSPETCPPVHIEPTSRRLP